MKKLNTETKEKFIKWLTAFPDSYHLYDMERFYDFLITADTNNDLDNVNNIDWESILVEYYPEWNNEYMNKFIEEWSNNISLCSDLLNYVNGKNK